MVEIITDKPACEALIASHRQSILDSFGYKKILNDWYNPDRYLFFRHGSDLIPLVVKNRMATFYGGAQFNHAHTLPRNALLINYVLDYLCDSGLHFRLLSIRNDIYPLLSEPHRSFDVPYPPEWHYTRPGLFRAEAFIEKISPRKRRRSYKYALIKRSTYAFRTLTFAELEAIFPLIMERHEAYFKYRGLRSAWEGNETLLLSLLRYFYEKEHLLVRTIYDADMEPAALYTAVWDTRELILYFGGSLNRDDHYISKVWYFDMLENITEIAGEKGIETINAMRGCFTNKRRFGFTPSPLYALVRDPQWHVERDADLTEDEYRTLYRRDFGAECECR